MALLDYTACDDVRAALGVSDDDLVDATILLPLYESTLAAELDEIDADLHDTYMTAKAIETPDRTRVQQRFVEAVGAFATYLVAKALLPGLPLFAPKDHSDGKATVSRFSTDPYKETMKQIEAKYDLWRTRVENALAGLNETTAVATPLPTYFAVSSPDSDPVTGT